MEQQQIKLFNHIHNLASCPPPLSYSFLFMAFPPKLTEEEEEEEEEERKPNAVSKIQQVVVCGFS
jgi:hypothetical protein